MSDILEKAIARDLLSIGAVFELYSSFRMDRLSKDGKAD